MSPDVRVITLHYNINAVNGIIIILVISGLYLVLGLQTEKRRGLLWAKMLAFTPGDSAYLAYLPIKKSKLGILDKKIF